MLRISTIASAIAIGLAGTIINAASPLVEDDIVSNSMSLELTPQQVRCQPLDGSPLKFIHQDRQLIERDIHVEREPNYTSLPLVAHTLSRNTQLSKRV